MAVNKQEISAWESDLNYIGETPSDIESTYRLLITLYRLNLFGLDTFWKSTAKNKIARIVIQRLAEMSLI